MRARGSIGLSAFIFAIACGPRGAGECYPIVVYDAVVAGGTNCVLTLSSATATVAIGIGDAPCNNTSSPVVTDVGCNGPVSGLYCARSCDRLFISATQVAADALAATLGTHLASDGGPPVAANVSCDGQVVTTALAPFAVQGCGL
jgi:hypothetical protein